VEERETEYAAPIMRTRPGIILVTPAHVFWGAITQLSTRLDDGVRWGIALNLNDVGLEEKHITLLPTGTCTRTHRLSPVRQIVVSALTGG